MKRVSVAMLAALVAVACSSPMGLDSTQTRTIGSNLAPSLDASAGLQLVQTATAPCQQCVDFGIPNDIPVTATNPPTDPGDEVIITGRPSGTTSATGCVGTPGDYPMQAIAIVAPGSGSRATHVADVILTSQTQALNPGTRLQNITTLPGCTAGGIQYNKYRADLP